MNIQAGRIHGVPPLLFAEKSVERHAVTGNKGALRQKSRQIYTIKRVYVLHILETNSLVKVPN